MHINEAVQRLKQSLDNVAAAKNDPAKFDQAIQEAKRQADALTTADKDDKGGKQQD